jgi:nicotinamidase-related amidase
VRNPAAPAKRALLIVDFQTDVVAEAYRRSETVAAIARVLAKARAERLFVVWVQHADEGLAPGTPGFAIAPELAPAQGELRLVKRHHSSFEGTDLDVVLEAHGITEIVLAGAQTNWCVRAAAYGALERGYDLTLVSDGHTTTDVDLGGGRVLAAADLIADLNLAVGNLDYPGRRSRTVPSSGF